MKITLSKEDRAGCKAPEIHQILGNSAMLQFTLGPVLQRVKLEEAVKLLMEAKESYKTEDDTKEDDSNWDDSNSVSSEETAEEICLQLGEITQTIDNISFHLIPDSQTVECILEGKKNVGEYLQNTFDYAASVYDKICKIPDLPEAFQKILMPKEKTEIYITILNADPHGFGPPIKLEKDGKAVVYKDRFGFADKIVTDLFKSINDITKTKLMPAYEQYAFEGTGLLSEFIEGEHPKGGHPSNDFHGDRDQFQALQWVAKQIGLTDLHFQNVILGKDRRIIPVDLEAFDTGAETGLYPPQVRRARPMEYSSPSAVPTPIEAPKETISTDLPEHIKEFVEASEDSDDDYVLGSSEIVAEAMKKYSQETPKVTNVGTPDTINPNQIFGVENTDEISKKIEETKAALFLVPKRFVPVSTSVYGDSWSPGATKEQVSGDMIEKTTNAFQKRGFKVEKDTLKKTMDNLVTVKNTIPVFVRIKDEIRQFDVITKEWNTVAVCENQSAQSLSESSST